MSLLTFALPRLVRDESPVALTPSQPPRSAAMNEHTHDSSHVGCTQVELAPVGLAFQRRATLMWILQAEKELRNGAPSQTHSSPPPPSKKAGQSKDVVETLLERVARPESFLLPIYEDDAVDDNNDDDSDEDNADDARDRAGQDARQQTAAKHKRFVKMSDEELLVDWYDVLRLPQGEGASPEQIRAAYRRRCLETHPDKQRDKSDAMFKKVQRAFEILDDAETRLSYDSSRPFDDDIPNEVTVRLTPADPPAATEGENVISAEEFYRLFGPVFERNKRWSVERDLPSLGDDDTPYDTVMQFYNRWNGFKSWRDFAHLVELAEIDESMCREEKRYYARENERQLASHRRAELKRVRTLVERALRADPRLMRRRLAAEEQRAKEKADREAFRQKMREESEQQRLAEAARVREEQEHAQRSKQQARQQMRASAQTLVDWLRGHELLDETPTNKIMSTVVRRPNIQWLFSKLATPAAAAEVVRVVCAADVHKRARGASEESQKDASASASQQPHTDRRNIHAHHGSNNNHHHNHNNKEDDDGACYVPAVEEFNRLLLEREGIVGLTRYGEPVKRAVPCAQEATSTCARANQEEARSSGGSSSSAAGASTATQHHNSPAGAGKGAAAAPTANVPPAVVWIEDDLLRLRKATMKYPPGSVERWSKISAALRGKFTAEQAMAKVAEITAGLQRKDHAQQQQQQQHTAAAALHSSGTSSTAVKENDTSDRNNHNDGGHGSNHATTSAGVTGGNVAGAAMESSGVQSASNGVVSMGGVPIIVPGLDEWTMKQQKQLEQGLRELKDYKEKDKFQKLAKLVEGKTAKECFDRFRYLCTLNKRK